MSKSGIGLSILVGILLGVGATRIWYSAVTSDSGTPSLAAADGQCKSSDRLNSISTEPSNSSFRDSTFNAPNNLPANQCVSEYDTNLDQPETARLISQLDNSRSILPNDLSRLNHWTSLSSLIKTLDQLALSDSSRNHLLAKAYVFYSQDYISALESLFSAQQAASNDERLEMFQAEIDVLIDHVKRQYFSENHLIAIDTFTAVMNLANEKQPNNVEVLVALVRHHMLVGEYALAENFIERVPPDVDNLVTIDSLTRRLTKTITASQSSDQGIPLTQLGNHFIVEVKFNQDHSLNLMLDTGASRTVLSPRSMRALMAMSEGVTDLKISGHAETANGFAFTKLFQTEQIAIRDFQLDKALVLVMNLSDNDQFDGLLGMDFLSRFQFRIDYQQKRLHLSY